MDHEVQCVGSQPIHNNNNDAKNHTGCAVCGGDIRRGDWSVLATDGYVRVEKGQRSYMSAPIHTTGALIQHRTSIIAVVISAPSSSTASSKAGDNAATGSGILTVALTLAKRETDMAKCRFKKR
jgi:hypothetical protein